MFKKFLKPKITITSNKKDNSVRTKMRNVKNEDFMVMIYYTIRSVAGNWDISVNDLLKRLRKLDRQVQEQENKAKK